MRLAVVPFSALLIAGAGATSSSNPAADATRAQWYQVVKRTGSESKEIVVEPRRPVAFAEHPGGKLTTLLGPLAHSDRAYLVTVVDAKAAPLLVLGWNPNAGQGEGIAWQAPGIRSDVIWGQPVLSERLGSAAWLRRAVLGSTR
jgi:hypothetical protein